MSTIGDGYRTLTYKIIALDRDAIEDNLRKRDKANAIAKARNLGIVPDDDDDDENIYENDFVYKSYQAKSMDTSKFPVWSNVDENTSPGDLSYLLYNQLKIESLLASTLSGFRQIKENDEFIDAISNIRVITNKGTKVFDLKPKTRTWKRRMKFLQQTSGTIEKGL